jgi:hypothetical protein
MRPASIYDLHHLQVQVSECWCKLFFAGVKPEELRELYGLKVDLLAEMAEMKRRDDEARPRHRATSGVPDYAPEQPCPVEFCVDGSVRFYWENFQFSPRQWRAVEVLRKAHACGAPELYQRTVLFRAKLKGPKGGLKDLFKDHPAFGKGKLIVPGGKRGWYKLNLP